MSAGMRFKFVSLSQKRLANDELLALLHIHTLGEVVRINLYTIEVVDRSIVVGNDLVGHLLDTFASNSLENVDAGDSGVDTIEAEGLITADYLYIGSITDVAFLVHSTAVGGSCANRIDGMSGG